MKNDIKLMMTTAVTLPATIGSGNELEDDWPVVDDITTVQELGTC